MKKIYDHRKFYKMNGEAKNWICIRCSAENQFNFCTNCGAAKPIKVYVGRRSLSMGDDANSPNMFSFYLSNKPEEVIDGMYGHGLPTYTSWEAHLGRRDYSSSEEDGVLVGGTISEEIIFKIFESEDPHKPKYEFTEGWYEKIKEHPYIYCR